MNIFEVKQKAVDALGEIDVSKLSIYDAHQYCEALHFLDKIKETDTLYIDAMKSLTEQMKTPYQPPKPTTLNDLK